MSTTNHIKLDGIEGESTSVDHQGEIELQSWSWGLTHSAPGISGAGVGSVRIRPVPEQFHFEHYYDRASPLLAKSAASGTAIKTAVLTARKAGEGQKDFLKITMKEVFVLSVRSNSAEGVGIVEAVAMSYASIEFAYQPATATGALGAAVTFCWDTTTNVVS